MRPRRPHIITLLALPALLLVGWFIVEQFPGWLAPPPPWERYPELVALPGGCEAALALANAGASRTDAVPEGSAITASLDAWMRTQFPQTRYELLTNPQGVRFGDGSAGWFSLIAFARDDEQSLTRGAIVFMTNDGGTRDIIHLIGGDNTRGDRCGDFAPQPRGLRAQLRPYLPLIAVAVYLLFASAGYAGWRLSKRKQG